MKSIKAKILFVVIAGLIGITAAVSSVAYTMTHNIMHRDADRILKNVAKAEAAQINDALGDVKKSATIMEHYASEELESIDLLADAEYRAEYLTKAKAMFTEIAVNTSGVEGYFMRVNPEFSDSTTGFYNLVNDDGSIKEMPVTDLSKYPEDDVKNVGWYYIPIKNGQGSWLDPYYFPGHNNQLISYTIPVYVDNELLGVVGFDMDFSYLVAKIDAIEVYDQGHAFLLAPDGKTMYNGAAQQEEENGHSHSHDNAAATVELINGMKLELHAEYKDIQKEIRPLLSHIIAIFVVIFVIAVIYTFLVTHRIVRPLKRLTDAAKKISTMEKDAAFEWVTIDSKDEVGELSTVLSEAYEKLHEYNVYINALAYRDSLTGIKNSTAYTEAIAELNKEINRGNPCFGVVVADINNLKLTNDKYGHDVGNDLIAHTAKILTSTLKTSAVFRIGGDEFVAILQGKDLDNYHSLLNALDKACEKDHIDVYENVIPVSLARGVAVFDPEIDKVYEDVFAKADHAMYLNKNETKALM